MKRLTVDTDLLFCDIAKCDFIPGGSFCEDGRCDQRRCYANSKRLQFNESGVTGLAHYIAKDKHFFKRWNQSRNLTIPQCAQFDGQLNMDDIADIEEAIECGTQWQWFEDRYPDFQLVEATCYKNNINRGTYIHFEMRRREWSGSSTAQPARMKKRTPSGRP